MCEPVSMTIGALCCCCLCVGLFLVATTVGPLLAEIANAVKEVATCVNDTIGEPLATSMKEDHCKQFTEKKCPELQEEKRAQQLQQLEGRRLDSTVKDEEVTATTTKGPNEDDEGAGGNTPSQLEQECMVLEGKCMCDIATKITATEDDSGFEVPTLKKRLTPCCSTFEDWESHPVFGEIAQPAGDMCKEIVHNVTNLIDELAQNCSKGRIPDNMKPDDLISGGAGALGGGGASPFPGIPAKFSMLEDVWQPSTAIANKVQPIATFGAGSILLIAAAAVGLRRRRGGNEGRRVQQLEVMVDQAVGVE